MPPQHPIASKRKSIPLTIAQWTLLAGLLAPACHAAGSAVHFDTVKITIKDKPFTLEIADTEPKRELGLMNRDSMPSDHGMLFIFDAPDNVGFWMKNTTIPLDLIYLNENGKVVGIHALKPLDETIVESEKPAKFAIELNAGTAKKIGLKVGDTIALPEKYLKKNPHPDDK